MAIPTLDQTEGIWIERTADSGYHYIQDVFPEENPREALHRANCRALIQRGSLVPEQPDFPSAAQRIWERTQRYCRVHQ